MRGKADVMMQRLLYYWADNRSDDAFAQSASIVGTVAYTNIPTLLIRFYQWQGKR
jgi:hypothetical protein